MTSKVVYQGHLRTSLTHLRSGSQLETDAPVDNHGKGERFSPTDLVATALASCMMTLMGIACDRHGIRDINGTTCDVEKIMASNPRRIGTIRVHVTVKGAGNYTDKEKQILERAALTCPVFQSLHPEINKDIQFSWPG